MPRKQQKQQQEQQEGKPTIDSEAALQNPKDVVETNERETKSCDIQDFSSSTLTADNETLDGVGDDVHHVKSLRRGGGNVARLHDSEPLEQLKLAQAVSQGLTALNLNAAGENICDHRPGRQDFTNENGGPSGSCVSNNEDDEYMTDNSETPQLSSREGVIGAIQEPEQNLLQPAFVRGSYSTGALPEWDDNNIRSARNLRSSTEDTNHSEKSHNRFPYEQQNSNLAVAVCIEPEELENDIREMIIQSSVQADVVNIVADEEKSTRVKKWNNVMRCTGCVLLIVAIAVGLGVGYYVRVGTSKTTGATMSSSVPTPSPTETKRPTLESISLRGFLRCGILEATELSAFFGVEMGSDEIMCRSVAAAIFGDPSKVELVTVPSVERYNILANETVDMLIAGVTLTMERDVHHSATGMGYTFSIPYYYDGLRFGGKPEYIQCVEDDIKNFFECADIKICATDGSTHMALLLDRLPAKQIQSVPSIEGLYSMFFMGGCNLIAHERILVSEQMLRRLGYTGDYGVAKVVFSKDPIASVTRDGDPEWSDFVNAVIYALIRAERMKITKETAHALLPPTHVFGSQYANMFQHAVEAAGNYGEIYNLSLSQVIPRDTMNLINYGSTGLIYSYPFGKNGPGHVGPVPTVGGTIDRINNRAMLRCGIRLARPGFAEVHVTDDDGSLSYHGMDVDLCHAISASLSIGSVKVSVEFIPVSDLETGYKFLSTGEIDLLAGSVWTLESDIREPSTGQGYTFSQPYFYGLDTGEVARSNSNSKNIMLDDDSYNLCLATRQDDPQWSSYVFWLLSSTFHADENGFTQRRSNEMPLIYFFGLDYARMFRDAILSVGSYGEIYERNVQQFIPRQGRNMVNSKLHPGPQHYGG